MGRGVARRDHVHVTAIVKLYMHTRFRSVAQRVFLAKIPYSAFSHYHGNYIPDF